MNRLQINHHFTQVNLIVDSIKSCSVSVFVIWLELTKDQGFHIGATIIDTLDVYMGKHLRI